MKKISGTTSRAKNNIQHRKIAQPSPHQMSSGPSLNVYRMCKFKRKIIDLKEDIVENLGWQQNEDTVETFLYFFCLYFFILKSDFKLFL